MHSVSVIFVFLFHSVCIAKLRWILLKLEYLFRSHLSSIVGFTDSLALSPGVRLRVFRRVLRNLPASANAIDSE